MDTRELIKVLRDILPPKVDYADLVCAEGGHHGFLYVWEDPEPYFIEEAANTLEKLLSENEQLTKRFEALLKDFKEIVLKPDDVCKYCKHNQPCKGKECEFYIKGKEAWDHNGCKHDWQWSCEDFNFGECPKLENTPCNGCIKNNMCGFEWRGIKE